MTRLLVRMERDGLLKRERDREDGRVIWIRATPKGTRTLLLRAGETMGRVAGRPATT